MSVTCLWLTAFLPSGTLNSPETDLVLLIMCSRVCGSTHFVNMLSVYQNDFIHTESQSSTNPFTIAIVTKVSTSLSPHTHTQCRHNTHLMYWRRCTVHNTLYVYSDIMHIVLQSLHAIHISIHTYRYTIHTHRCAVHAYRHSLPTMQYTNNDTQYTHTHLQYTQHTDIQHPPSGTVFMSTCQRGVWKLVPAAILLSRCHYTKCWIAVFKKIVSG